MSSQKRRKSTVSNHSQNSNGFALRVRLFRAWSKWDWPSIKQTWIHPVPWIFQPHTVVDMCMVGICRHARMQVCLSSFCCVSTGEKVGLFIWKSVEHMHIFSEPFIRIQLCQIFNDHYLEGMLTVNRCPSWSQLYTCRSVRSWAVQGRAFLWTAVTFCLMT